MIQHFLTGCITTYLGGRYPKCALNFSTDEYGFITDYVSEFMREMRKRSFSDALDKFFKLGNNLIKEMLLQ